MAGQVLHRLGYRPRVTPGFLLPFQPACSAKRYAGSRSREAEGHPLVISTKAEGRAEKSGREWTTRQIRSQMSRLRCAAKAQHLVFLASIFGCGRRPRRAPLDMTDGAGFPPNRYESQTEPHAFSCHFFSCTLRRRGAVHGGGEFRGDSNKRRACRFTHMPRAGLANAVVPRRRPSGKNPAANERCAPFAAGFRYAGNRCASCRGSALLDPKRRGGASPGPKR